MGCLSCESGIYFGCVGDSLRARGLDVWENDYGDDSWHEERHPENFEGSVGKYFRCFGKLAICYCIILVWESFDYGYMILLMYSYILVGLLSCFIWCLTYPYVFIYRLTYPYVFCFINVLVHSDWTTVLIYLAFNVSVRFMWHYSPFPGAIPNLQNVIDSSTRAAENKLSDAASTISISCKITDLSA